MSDPLDRLRAANPVPPGSVLPAPDPLLLARITSDLAPVRPAPPRRARRLVPVAVLGASLLGGTIAYALIRDDVTKPQNVACYQDADPEARTEVVRVDDGGPVAACAGLWRRGVLGPGRTVPRLEECTLASGVAAVFPATPGRDTCAALLAGSTVPPAGQPPAPGPGPPPPEDVNARVLALRDALVPQFVNATCLDPAAAAALVGGELERAGLGDWTVRGGGGGAPEGFTPEEPCATLSLRPEAREVVLVPSAPRR